MPKKKKMTYEEFKEAAKPLIEAVANGHIKWECSPEMERIIEEMAAETGKMYVRWEVMPLDKDLTERAKKVFEAIDKFDKRKNRKR